MQGKMANSSTRATREAPCKPAGGKAGHGTDESRMTGCRRPQKIGAQTGHSHRFLSYSFISDFEFHPEFIILCGGMTAPALNPQITGLPVYVPGKSIEEVARELGMDPEVVIKLASN